MRSTIYLIAFMIVLNTAFAQNTFMKSIGTYSGGIAESRLCEASGQPGNIFLTYSPLDYCYTAVLVHPDGQRGFVKTIRIMNSTDVNPMGVLRAHDGYAIGATIVELTGFINVVLMLDAQFNVRWARKLSSAYPNPVWSETTILPTENKGVILLAKQSYDSDSTTYAFEMSRLDSSGTVLWSRQGLPGKIAMVEPDGHIVIGRGSANAMFTLMRFLPDGTVDWNRAFHISSPRATPAAITQLANGGYAVLLSVNDMTPSEGRTQVAWFDSQWTWQHTTELSTPGTHFIPSQILPDEIGGGVTISIGTGTGSGPWINEYHLAHLSGSGGLDWAHSTEIGDKVLAKSLSRVGTEGYLVSGAAVNGTFNSNFISKHLPSGEGCSSVPVQLTVRADTFSTVVLPLPSLPSVLALGDTAAVYIWPYPIDSLDLCLSTSLNEASQPESLHAPFPNPVVDEARIRLPEGGSGRYDLTAYDAMGRMHPLEVTREGTQLRFSVAGLSPGMYRYRLLSGRKEVLAGKFVVAR